MSFDQELRSLESVCNLITDGSHFSPAPQAEGFPIVNAKDIPDGRINLDSCTRISQADWVALKKQNCAPIPDDVLLSKDGTIGRVVHYKADLGVVVLSSIAILRPNNSIDSRYLAQALCSDAFRGQLRVLESGSALRRIILRDIKGWNSVSRNKKMSKPKSPRSCRPWTRQLSRWRR
jgi:type I restriction enzyme S subunit